MDWTGRCLALQVSTLADRIDTLAVQMSTLTSHVAELRGESLELRYRRRAYGYFATMVRRAHVLTDNELATLLEDAVDRGALARDEAHDISWADIVVRGRSVTDGSLV